MDSITRPATDRHDLLHLSSDPDQEVGDHWLTNLLRGRVQIPMEAITLLLEVPSGEARQLRLWWPKGARDILEDIFKQRNMVPLAVDWTGEKEEVEIDLAALSELIRPPEHSPASTSVPRAGSADGVAVDSIPDTLRRGHLRIWRRDGKMGEANWVDLVKLIKPSNHQS